MDDQATKLALPIVADAEGFRAWPYPDPASPLGKATRGIRWGFHDPKVLLAGLPPKTRGLSPAPITIGYGETGKNITFDTPPWSESVAKVNLGESLQLRVDEVRRQARKAGVTFTDPQVAALASFLFNVGPGGPKKDGLFALKSGRPSTLWRKATTGDHKGAADQFGAWVNAGGVQLPGLVTRRARERQLYLRAS